MVFYSDIGDGPDALADTGFPSVFNTNTKTILESGPEGSNGATYTPGANEPGFIPGFAVTYTFISDASVPEPSAPTMMVGLAIFGVAVWSQRRKVAKTT